MAKWATKVLYRLPGGLFLFACLAVCIALDSNVLWLDIGSVAGSSSRNGFSIHYQWQPENIQQLLTANPVVLGSLFFLALLCFILPAFNLLQGVAISLCSAVLVVLLFQSNSLAHTSDGHQFTLNQMLRNVAVIYIVFIVVRALLVLLRRRKVNLFLRHYIPARLFQHYMRNPEDIGMTGEARHMTIMFCDIKRFTAISERLDPELLPEWLNRYFDVVSDVVVRHGGTVDKYIGDSVMAFWGAPDRSETHACDALMAAREILLALETLSDQLVAEERPPIEVGIGLSTGYANVGHLGSRERMTYTVVGDAVNTADRLQRCTGFYNLPLVVNDTATENVPEFLFRELDTVHVKGRQRFVRIFQPICHQDEAVPNTHRQLQLHRKAMQFYRRGMWEDAEKLFRLLSSETQEINFYKKYIERMVDIRQSEPEDGSNYVVDFTQKIG